MAKFVGWIAVLILGTMFSESALAIVIPNPAPAATVSPAVSSLAQIVANGMIIPSATLVASAIRGSVAKDNASALAQTIIASVEQADSAYAQSHQSGPGPDLVVRGAPYRPYEHAAASARAVALGQGISEAGVSSSAQAAAYAEAFTQSFLQQTSLFQGLYGGFTVATQTLLAAEAANQTSAYTQIFTQAKAANVSVQNVASVLATPGTDLPVGGPSALEVANSVYGATAASLAAVAGNASAVADSILASMYLDVTQQAVVTAVLVGNNDTLSNLQQGSAQNTTNATAHNISQAINAANLSAPVITSALEQAIGVSIPNVQSGSDPAILIQAAVLLGQTEPAVTQGFARAKAANASLTDACNSERVAQAISPAAGQAAAAAVSSGYGASVDCSQAN